jgi:hypothetical protein
MYTVEHPLTAFTNTATVTTVASGATVYHDIFGGGLNATQNLRQAPMAIGGIFKYGYLATSTSQPNTGSLVATLQVNLADTSVVITVASNSAAGTFSDTTNTATATAGQLCNWKFKNNASSTSAATIGIGVYYFNSDAHYTQPKSIIGGSFTSITVAGSSGTLYEYLVASGTNATENARQVIFPIAGTLKYAYLKTGTSQPATGSLVRTLRKNGADQSIVITVALGSVAGLFSDTTNTVSVAAGDVLNWKVVNNALTVSATQIAIATYFY